MDCALSNVWTTGRRSSRHYKQAWVKEKKTAGRLRREREIPSFLHIRSQALIWGRAYCINGITGEDSVATPLLLTPRIYNLINEKKSRPFFASLAILRIFAFAHTWMLQVKFNSAFRPWLRKFNRLGPDQPSVSTWAIPPKKLWLTSLFLSLNTLLLTENRHC